jgi:hypothetical protein
MKGKAQGIGARRRALEGEKGPENDDGQQRTDDRRREEETGQTGSRREAGGSETCKELPGSNNLDTHVIFNGCEGLVS